MDDVTEFDVIMMRRAMGLAMRGRGTVEPNPSVGCVIVKEGRVIGEGRTQAYGGAHAEPTAIGSCRESAAGGTAYVTLEPCCHVNKRTPPCVPVVIGAGIKRVVVGCLDPNPEVNGKGVAMLREAGVEVGKLVLEAECKQLIAAFVARVKLGRPYVTLKWAESADGKIAGGGGIPIRISNDQSWRAVHELRTRCDAILVGSGTALVDNPRLTPRGVEVIRRPIRVVVDSQLRMLSTSVLVKTARMFPTVVFTKRSQLSSMKGDELRGSGIELIGVTEKRQMVSLKEVVEELGRRNVSHLLVEAGPGIARGFFEEGLADRVWVFRSERMVEDVTAPGAAVLPGEFVGVGECGLGDNVLREYLNAKSEVFFAGVESADLRRVEG